MFKPSREVDTFEQVNFSDMKFPLITVYEKPLDFPDKYVARIFDLHRPTDVVLVKDSLEGIREDIPTRFTQFERSKHDDPAIVELWI